MASRRLPQKPRVDVYQHSVRWQRGRIQVRSIQEWTATFQKDRSSLSCKTIAAISSNLATVYFTLRHCIKQLPYRLAGKKACEPKWPLLVGKTGLRIDMSPFRKVEEANEPRFQLLFARWHAKSCKGKSLSRMLISQDGGKYGVLWKFTQECFKIWSTVIQSPAIFL